MAMGLLASSLMAALSQPIVGLIFGGGRFTPSDVQLTAIYFALYSIGLFMWSAQAIYARAFYAAGVTWLPMLSSTIVMAFSFLLYGWGYRWHGAAGLALASDAGIALQALSLAFLLHMRRMVSLASIEFDELGRCFFAAVAGGVAAFGLKTGAVWIAVKLGHTAMMETRWADAMLLIAGGLLWLGVVDLVLNKLGSALPVVMRKRLGLA
jgi:putative peptidoglycan lipid II flippase